LLVAKQLTDLAQRGSSPQHLSCVHSGNPVCSNVI
jgi:hypothetical protein